MTAICAAGPPKLSIATRNQTRNASPSDTACRADGVIFSMADICDTPDAPSGRRTGGRPTRLRLQAAPVVAVERPPVPNVDQHGCRRRAETGVKIGRRNGKGASAHTQSPRQASVAQCLDEKPV